MERAYSSVFRNILNSFDMFFRHVPNDGGFAIMAGVQQLIEYFDHLHFSEEDIAYLASTQLFSVDFLDYSCWCDIHISFFFSYVFFFFPARNRLPSKSSVSWVGRW